MQKKPFFSHIHRFQHTSYADIEGMCENGYEGMPPVEEMIAAISLWARHPLSRLPLCHLSPLILLKWQGKCSSRSDPPLPLGRVRGRHGSKRGKT